MKTRPVLLFGAAVFGVGIYLAYHLAQRPAGAQAAAHVPIASMVAANPLPAGTNIAPSIPSSDGKSVDDVSALREEVAFLRAEVASLRRSIPSQVLAQSEMQTGPEKNLRTDPLARAEAERNRQTQMAAVESHFRSEQNDPKWSSRATSLVRDALSSDEAARAGMRNIECRSQSCRVEIVNDGTGQLPKFMPLFAQQVAQSFPNITANQVDQGNGARITVLYLSRESTPPRVTE